MEENNKHQVMWIRKFSQKHLQLACGEKTKTIDKERLKKEASLKALLHICSFVSLGPSRRKLHSVNTIPRVEGSGAGGWRAVFICDYLPHGLVRRELGEEPGSVIYQWEGGSIRAEGWNVQRRVFEDEVQERELPVAPTCLSVMRWLHSCTLLTSLAIRL